MQDGVGHRTDPELHRGPVGDPIGDAGADRAGGLVEDPRTVVGQLLLDLDRQIDVGLGQHGVTEGIGHPRVHLRDHQGSALAGGLDRRHQDVDLDPEGDGSFVRQGSVNQDDVRRQGGMEQPGYQGQS